MNPIERLFTSIIQRFLTLAVTLVQGLFGGNIRTDPPQDTDPEDPKAPALLESEHNDAP